MNEPIIIINGHVLNNAQSATIRVALETFDSDLYENGLGDDEPSKRITILYRQRIDEIRKCIFKENKND